MRTERNPLGPGPARPPAARPEAAGLRRAARFPLHGEEMIAKQVQQPGSSGRVYLPQHWVGKRVKAVRAG
jgi:hypothetical protein